MNADRTFEIIAANGETEFGWNLYTPEYGVEFVGNYPTYAEALRTAIDKADPGEVAVVDQYSHHLTRVTIKVLA